MKNVTVIDYLRHEFIRFETEEGDVKYLLYVKLGAIISPDIDTIKAIIEENVEYLKVAA
jgi:hypothetical protein